MKYNSANTTSFTALQGMGWPVVAGVWQAGGVNVARIANHRMCRPEPKPNGEPGAS